MPHPLHDQVRARFDARCGYCGVAEVDTAGDLTVDHHQPLSAGGPDLPSNLVYACFRCNLYKGDYWPTPDALRAGRRVLHPLQDNGDDHLRLDTSTGVLEPLTETGRFHIALLRLNRPPLVQYRLRRQLEALERLKQALAEEEQAHLRETIAHLEATVAGLHRRPEAD